MTVSFRVHGSVKEGDALFNWPLALREERRLGVFENRVLRGIFGFKMDEVTGDWRRLYNEQTQGRI